VWHLRWRHQDSPCFSRNSDWFCSGGTEEADVLNAAPKINFDLLKECLWKKKYKSKLFSSTKQRVSAGPMLHLPTLLSFGKCFRYSADMGRLLSALVTSILMLWQLGNRGLCQGFRKMFNNIVNLTLSLFYYFRTWNNSHSNAVSRISSKRFTILFSVTQSNPTPIWYVQSKSWRDPHSLTSKHRHSQLHPETMLVVPLISVFSFEVIYISCFG